MIVPPHTHAKAGMFHPSLFCRCIPSHREKVLVPEGLLQCSPSIASMSKLACLSCSADRGSIDENTTDVCK